MTHVNHNNILRYENKKKEIAGEYKLPLRRGRISRRRSNTVDNRERRLNIRNSANGNSFTDGIPIWNCRGIGRNDVERRQTNYLVRGAFIIRRLFP